MPTLMVEPRVLLQVADRLEQLAAHPPIAASSVRECLSRLEESWSGGSAAPLAFARLRQLIGLMAPLTLSEMDALPAAERDRLNRERFAGHPALERLSAYLARPDALLMGFDPAGDGRLIVAFGDPDVSRNVATYVPGAGSSLDSIAGELNRAQALRERAGTDTSVIMWLGYDSPDGADAALTTAARAAGEPLRQFQAGLVANHDGEIGQQTVIGHSYGSVVVGLADQSADLPGDDIVALGSPGMGVSEAAKLRDPAQVWASTAPDDWIRYVPDFILGRDPDHPSFGARTLPSAPMGHSGYLDPANPSLNHLTQLITTGDLN